MGNDKGGAQPRRNRLRDQRADLSGRAGLAGHLLGRGRVVYLNGETDKDGKAIVVELKLPEMTR